MKARTAVSGLLAAVFLPTAASAHPHPCRWDVFTPMSFEQQITDDLPLLAMSAIPTTSRPSAVPSGRSLLLDGRRIVGSVEWMNDPRRGQGSLSVFDTSQVLLFQVTEREYICPGRTAPGLCQEVTIVSEQQPRDGSGNAPFQVVLVPGDYWPHYWRYGTEVAFAGWRHELMDNYQWLGATLDAISNGYLPRTDTPQDKIFWAMAANPFLVPYLPRLSFEMRQGHLVGRGVLPSNAVYSAVVDAALDAGFYDFQPLMVIDTGSDLPPDLTPTIGSCGL